MTTPAAPKTSYDPSMPMRAALARYFVENGFGEDGGYADPWVHFKLGPIPLPFPNTPARVRAVRYHDLHHLITGYRADQATGEFEISAWEIGAGCREFWAAWLLNLSGMTAGLVSIPRRTFQAFVIGRRSSSLYGREYEPLLDKTVGEVAAACGIDWQAQARASDVALFAACTAVGLVIGLALFALALLVSPPLALFGWLRRSLHKQAPAGA